MLDSKTPEFEYYGIVPFNTKMIMDNKSVTTRYDELRKNLFQKLNMIYPNQITIERFQGKENEQQLIQNWLVEEKRVIVEKGKLIFGGTGGMGVTQKDNSIITINVNKKFELAIDILGIDIFIEPPVATLQWMSYHEYGVGMMYFKFDLKVKRDLLSLSETKPKYMFKSLLVKSLVYPSIAKVTEEIDKNVFKVYQEAVNLMNLQKPVFSYEDLYKNQTPSIPLWGHMVLIHKKDKILEAKLLDNEVLKLLMESSHPDGLIDYAKGSPAYVHTGWGESLWYGLDDLELSYVRKILRYSEVEWRTLQILNELLYKRMNQFAEYEELKKRIIVQTMDWIDDVKMEMELYDVNKQNFMQNLAPFSHFVYIGNRISWRIDEMEKFYNEKLETFSYLHEQGQERLKQINNEKLNNILFIFTCLSLVSTFLDVFSFLFPDIFGENMIIRLILAIVPPILFIVVIMLIFARVYGSRK